MKKLKFTKTAQQYYDVVHAIDSIYTITTAVYEDLNDVLDYEQKVRKAGVKLDANLENMLAAVHAMHAAAIGTAPTKAPRTPKENAEPKKRAGRPKKDDAAPRKRGRPKGSKNKKPGKRGRPKGSKDTKPRAKRAKK